MSKTDTTAKNKNSMATFFKVLRFIGKYRFLLVLSVILAAVTVILQLTLSALTSGLFPLCSHPVQSDHGKIPDCFFKSSF